MTTAIELTRCDVAAAGDYDVLLVQVGGADGIADPAELTACAAGRRETHRDPVDARYVLPGARELVVLVRDPPSSSEER